MAKDIVDYMGICFSYATHPPKKPLAPDQPATIDQPLQVVGTDHVGPFSALRRLLWWTTSHGMAGWWPIRTINATGTL